METLRHCFPPNLRQFLNELPESLDETYERILRGINKAQKDNARRLLQCLTVAVRPLRVEELAELLAFDFQATSSGGIPKLKEDWRWDDQEEAVLSTCSSLIAVVRSGDSRVVQFSHFSVKEYLTSHRLAQSHGDVSRFYIDLDAAHTILAQACLGTLFRLDEQTSDLDDEWSPLVEYAAEHWVDHAQFGRVVSRVCDGMDDLFDESKPHFARWLRMHDIDDSWGSFSGGLERGAGSPLYYAAFCGFYDLTKRLIMKHPEQINAGGGRNLAPLPTALYKRHFRVASLLREHGAVVDVRGGLEMTPLHAASSNGDIDLMRWLLNHGADANAQTAWGNTPLHMSRPEVVQVLLDHSVHINLQNNKGETPLYKAISRPFSEGDLVDFVRRLLEHGADTNMPDPRHSTPLHQASSQGSLEVARLLLNHGAIVDEKDREGRTPFQIASEKGHHELTKLLLEHGTVSHP